MNGYELVITNVVGEFTSDTEVLGKQDPYIYFKIDNAEVQTKAIRGVGAGRAQWDGEYTLQNFHPEVASLLHVKVYNSNLMRRDNFIADGFVDLATVHPFQLDGRHAKLIVPLANAKNKYMGSLSFHVNAGGYKGRGMSKSGSSSSSEMSVPHNPASFTRPVPFRSKRCMVQGVDSIELEEAPPGYPSCKH